MMKLESTQHQLISSKLFVLFLAVFAMTACSSGQHGDLESYVAEVKQRPGSKIEDLPAAKHYEPFSYAAFDLRDPFTQFLLEDPNDANAEATGTGGPNTDRKKEPLEAFPLGSLAFVGILEKKKVRWGLIATPDKTVYKVQVGNYMGKDYGEIVQISETKIILKEIIPDGTGGWIDREASINVIEQ